MNFVYVDVLLIYHKIHTINRTFEDHVSWLDSIFAI